MSSRPDISALRYVYLYSELWHGWECVHGPCLNAREATLTMEADKQFGLREMVVAAGLDENGVPA